MKEILEKYPWLSYEVKLENMPYSFWLLLGQCVSKCCHIRQIPLLPDVRDKLHNLYLAKGVAATTAIEGNTLGEEKVLDIIKGTDRTEQSKQYQKQEVQNIINACNYVFGEIAQSKDIKITTDLLCRLNEMVLSGGVPTAEDAIPGQIRSHSVVVGSYRCPDAKYVRQLLDKFCQWINGLGGEIENLIGKEAVAIIRAITAHLYMVWIHPFGDGNGRTARLIEFMILLNSGIPSAAAHLLSNHYNLTRVMYYKNLDLAGRANKSQDFFRYAVEGFRDGLQQAIDDIIQQVQFISWQHYIYERYKELSDNVSKRQRDVMIEISKQHFEQQKPLTKEEIEKICSSIYLNAGKQLKSFTRDFNTLINEKLIITQGNGFVPNIEPILQRLPFSI